MKSFDDIRLAGEGMVAARGLAARHLCFDGLETMQHLILEPLERRVEDALAHLVESSAHLQTFTSQIEVSEA